MITDIYRRSTQMSCQQDLIGEQMEQLLHLSRTKAKLEHVGHSQRYVVEVYKRLY